jgi:hypothetical protein
MDKKYEEYLGKAEGFPALDWEAYTRSIAELHLPRFKDFPDLQLYMDQLIDYVGQQLELFRLPGEKPLTASMVNNYVKRHLVPQPRAKRYLPLHVAYLISVCLLKRLYSMDDIDRLIAFDVEHRFQASGAYDKFIDLFEASLKAQFLGRSEAGTPGGIEMVAVTGAFAPVVAHPEDLTHVDRMYIMAATSTAAKIYTEQTLVAARYQDALDALAKEQANQQRYEQLHQASLEAREGKAPVRALGDGGSAGQDATAGEADGAKLPVM